MQFTELNTEIKIGRTKMTYHKIQKTFSAELLGFFVLAVLATDTACAVVVGFIFSLAAQSVLLSALQLLPLCLHALHTLQGS